jgi:hypothetical protein
MPNALPGNIGVEGGSDDAVHGVGHRLDDRDGPVLVFADAAIPPGKRVPCVHPADLWRRGQRNWSPLSH